MTSLHNKKLAELLESGDVLGFKTLVKKVLTEELDDQIPSIIDAPPLGSMNAPAEEVEPEADLTGSDEASTLDQIRRSAVSAGGDEGYYDGGVLDLSIPTLDGSKEFSAFLDACDSVESYEIEGLSFDDTGDILPGEDKDLAEIKEGDYVAYEFYVYLNPDLVTEIPSIVEDSEIEPDENTTLEEMKRVVRVAFGSGKRSKMTCKPGTKYSSSAKKCMKLGEDMQFNNHKAMKRSRVAAKSISGASHTQVSKKSFKNAKARKKFGSGR
jgi:hypothetical protein